MLITVFVIVIVILQYCRFVEILYILLFNCDVIYTFTYLYIYISLSLLLVSMHFYISLLFV